MRVFKHLNEFSSTKKKMTFTKKYDLTIALEIKRNIRDEIRTNAIFIVLRASPKYVKCPKKDSVIKVSLESDLLFSSFQLKYD